MAASGGGGGGTAGAGAGAGARVAVLPKVAKGKKKGRGKAGKAKAGGELRHAGPHTRRSVLETPSLTKLTLAELHDAARTECFEPGKC